MKKWASLLLYFFFLQSFAQYNYTYTDPCTLQSKSVFVPAGGGVTVNYFNNNSVFTSNDFSSGAFDNWISLVSQQNSNSPCESVTTTVVNGIATTVVSNTIGIVTNVVSISSIAQSMASISSSAGSNIPTTGGETSSTGTGSSQVTGQEEGGTSGITQPTQGGEQTSQPTVGSDTGTSTENISSGNTANSVSNAIDGGSNGGGSSSSSSKKQSNAKTSSGSLIASGDMVIISNTGSERVNQYKFVGSITHANTRGTRIKGVLFTFTTGVSNMNVTLYKSWINKSRSLNLIVANSTMMDFDKNIFNTTTGLESYKVNKNVTTMFGLNFTAGKMGERSFLNLSAVGGGHVSAKVTNRVSTSFLILGVYSPFTQFYNGKWWSAGVLFVPFSSWDFKITKTFKYNVSFTGVYEMNQSFLNYQILTGGKITF